MSPANCCHRGKKWAISLMQDGISYFISHHVPNATPHCLGLLGILEKLCNALRNVGAQFFIAAVFEMVLLEIWINQGSALVGRSCTSEAPAPPNTSLSFSVLGILENGAVYRYNMYMISRELKYSNRHFLSHNV